MKWFSMHKIINDLFTILSISKIIFLLILIWNITDEMRKNEHLLIYSRVILVSQGPR